MLDIAGETKGAGAGDVARIATTGHVKRHLLTCGVNRWVMEIDLEAQLEAVMGVESSPFDLIALPFANFHRLGDPQKTLGRVLLHDACALQQKHKRGGRAVKDGHLFGGDVNEQVVQTKAMASRHQVLDRVNFGALGLDGGSQSGVGHGQSMDRNGHGLRQIHSAKHDACVRRGRTQGELNPLSAVQAHANGMGHGLNGSLFQHCLILISLLSQERRDLIVVHAT